MDNVNLINSLWLTVNRKCNLRCSWCYAEGTDYSECDDMSLSTAFNLFYLGYNTGIRNVVILGGEPTLWKNLPELIYKMNEVDPSITPVIVTNGILFSSAKFRKKLQGLNYKVSISLKASSKNQYKELTGFDNLRAVLNSIRFLTDEDILSGISVTINNRIINDLIEMTKLVSASGGRSISFEMCAPSFDKDGNPSGEYLVHPADVVQEIVDCYPEMNQIMGGQVFFQMSVPFCLFPEGFIQQLTEDGKIISGCHVFERSGIIFNPQGGVLLCNCLHHLPIGFYNKDFYDARTFINWWNNKEVKKTNERLLVYPSNKCVNCKQYNHCGGGCCLQWFYFNPEKIIKGVCANEI